LQDLSQQARQSKHLLPWLGALQRNPTPELTELE